ncbi:MAG: DUF6152 family protein [Pseudomonadales bacterium]|nr:DUF6152 family protein [Pseudomonadales bacterium]
MMRKLARILLVISTVTLGLVSGMAQGHHNFAAQYDAEKTAQLQGVVVKVDWLNPHAYFYIDVTDEKTGEVLTWACELGAPVSLMRRGWTRHSLSIGEIVNVEGNLSRDGSTSLSAFSVILESSGQKLFSGQN